MRKVEHNPIEPTLLPSFPDGLIRVQVPSVDLPQHLHAHRFDLADDLLGVRVLEEADLASVVGGCEDLGRRRERRVGG
jgi:hypothetical protein